MSGILPGSWRLVGDVASEDGTDMVVEVFSWKVGSSTSQPDYLLRTRVGREQSTSPILERLERTLADSPEEICLLGDAERFFLGKEVACLPMREVA
jgi:hypothetical protein